jgi:hypothetical protein
MLSTKRRLTFRARRTFNAWADFQATAALVEAGKKILLKNPGVRPLERKELSRIRDYARSRFGSVGFAPWLEFYALFRGEFREGWIPANFFQTVAIRKLNGLPYGIGASRSLMTRILDTPMLPDRAHFVSGEWRDLSGAHLDRDKVPSLIFGDDAEVCVKVESTSRGRGVSFAHRDNLDLADIEGLGDLVVQSAIRHHPLFDEVSPRAVVTLRVSTGKLPGRPPFSVGSYLRCSLGEGRVVGESSLRVGIVDDDGRLAAFGSDPTWRRYTTHPETGAVLDGWQIPAYRKMVASCVELHDRLPQLGFIGWDVTLDEKGEVLIMEVNTGDPDIKFIEMSQGPTLRAFKLERYAATGRAVVPG